MDSLGSVKVSHIVRVCTESSQGYSNDTKWTGQIVCTTGLEVDFSGDARPVRPSLPSSATPHIVPILLRAVGVVNPIGRSERFRASGGDRARPLLSVNDLNLWFRAEWLTWLIGGAGGK